MSGHIPVSGKQMKWSDSALNMCVRHTQTCCSPEHGIEAWGNAFGAGGTAIKNGPVMVVECQLLHANSQKPACYCPHCHAGNKQTRRHL